jgi:hypothetical protein
MGFDGQSRRAEQASNNQGTDANHTQKSGPPRAIRRPAGQNGSGVASVQRMLFDQCGNMTWEHDADPRMPERANRE